MPHFCPHFTPTFVLFYLENIFVNYFNSITEFVLPEFTVIKVSENE